MKKIFALFIFICCLSFLVGCAHDVDKPVISIVEATGSILVETPDTIIPGEYGYLIDKQFGRKISYISGYKYYYSYNDLGLKIEISWGYEDYSYKKTTGEILKREKNILYYGDSPNAGDYIEVFFKDPSTSLEKEIIKKHLPKGCSILTGKFDNYSAFYPSMTGFDVVYITSVDGNLASNGEIFDKQFPENRLNISFVMDPKKPNKYYKISHGDCAPGPCTIFGNIEFF